MRRPPQGLITNPRFRLDRHLGSGGMGSIYAAWDLERDEAVAVKTLRFFDAPTLYTLKREFRTLAEVVHPNLVTLYDFFAEDELAYFTMEWVQGEDLLTWHRAINPGPARRRRLRDVLRQITGGLRALHRAEKVHCDLKPTNILVTPEDRAVILDFGLSQDLSPRISARSLDDGVGGLLPYLGPEIFRGDPPAPPSDFYALGVVLFEILVGRLPFEGSPGKILSEKLDKESPHPLSVQEDLPADLADLCADLLVPQPKMRPRGSEILDRLARRDESEEISRPEPETDELMAFADRLREQLDLIGREDASDFLQRASDASRDEAVAVWVHGQPGVGKTTLIRAFLHRAAERDEAVILDGRCYERESVPYKALDGILDSLTRYLRTLPNHEVESLMPREASALVYLFPVLQRVEVLAQLDLSAEPERTPDRRRRGVAALREVLARIAARRPLMLYVEDLHWADTESVELLQEILRFPDSPALLLLGCFRREEIQELSFLLDLIQATDRRRRELALEPLLEETITTFVRRRFPETDLATIRKIYLESQGNPWLVDQMLTTASQSIGEMMATLLAELPLEAEVFLRGVAEAEEPVDAESAFRDAGLQGDERPLVTRLRNERLLRVRATPIHGATFVEIYHEQIRRWLAIRPEASRSQVLSPQKDVKKMENPEKDNESAEAGGIVKTEERERRRWRLQDGVQALKRLFRL